MTTDDAGITPRMAELPDDHPLRGPAAVERMQAALRERIAWTGLDTPGTSARLRMSQATRRAIEELLSTTASDDDLAEAANMVERAVELLASRPHGRPYEGSAEGSLGTISFVDHSPFVGWLNPLAPPIRVDVVGERIVGTAVYGAPYEGPPGCLHGGFIAAGFDEVLGFVQSLGGGQPGMTAKLDIRYRSPTPLHREVRYVGWVESVDGRKILTHATLSDGDRLCAEASGLFISIKQDVFTRLLESRGAEPAG